MCKLPKDKRRLIRFICDQGGGWEEVDGTGEIRVQHPESARRVKTGHWSRDNDPPKGLQLMVKDVMRQRGINEID